jgi:hypothetical protein
MSPARGAPAVVRQDRSTVRALALVRTIGSTEFLLPQSAIQIALFNKTWTKAEIQFRQYRKYNANSIIKFDREEFLPVRN